MVFPRPTSFWYHSQASWLMGSPTGRGQEDQFRGRQDGDSTRSDDAEGGEVEFGGPVGAVLDEEADGRGRRVEVADAEALDHLPVPTTPSTLHYPPEGGEEGRGEGRRTGPAGVGKGGRALEEDAGDAVDEGPVHGVGVTRHPTDVRHAPEDHLRTLELHVPPTLGQEEGLLEANGVEGDIEDEAVRDTRVEAVARCGVDNA